MAQPRIRLRPRTVCSPSSGIYIRAIPKAMTVSDRPIRERRLKPFVAPASTRPSRGRYGLAPGRQSSNSVRLAISELTLISQFLYGQYAVTIWLAVRQFALVAPGGPGLLANLDLAAIVPLALIGLERHICFGPLYGSGSFRATVGTQSRPFDQFLQLRVGIPDLTTGFSIRNPSAGMCRRGSNHGEGEQCGRCDVLQDRST